MLDINFRCKGFLPYTLFSLYIYFNVEKLLRVVSFVFWGRISLCSLGWLQILDLVLLASQMGAGLVGNVSLHEVQKILIWYNFICQYLFLSPEPTTIKSIQRFLKNKNRAISWYSSIPSGCAPLSIKTSILLRYLCGHISCCAFQNGQVTDAAQVLISRRMDKENVAYVLDATVFNHTKNKAVFVIAILKELEILLSESPADSQRQNFPLLCICELGAGMDVQAKEGQLGMWWRKEKGRRG